MMNKAKQFLLETLQKALNRYLALDPESSQRLAALNGKWVALELLPLKLTFFLHFNQGQALLSSSALELPETTITGTPLRLMLLALVPHTERKRFFADDVVMLGNAALGQQVIELFDQLSIDWEEYISRVVGDVPAHHAGNIVRQASNWMLKTRDILLQNLNEYMHEEINLFPPGEALQDFFHDVDVLRMDTDKR
jgi:ubiquinone biosynthesis protein UbiJ